MRGNKTINTLGKYNFMLVFLKKNSGKLYLSITGIEKNLEIFFPIRVDVGSNPGYYLFCFLYTGGNTLMVQHIWAVIPLGYASFHSLLASHFMLGFMMDIFALDIG